MSHTLGGTFFITKENVGLFLFSGFCQEVLMSPNMAVYSNLTLQGESVFLRKFNFEIRYLLVSCPELILLCLYGYKYSKKPDTQRKHVGA